MSEVNRMHIVNLLKDYTNNKRRIALLTYELENFQPITEAEMLGAMSYARSTGGFKVSPGAVSDKTARIAIEYHEKTAQANAQLQEELAQRLVLLMREVNRLEKYVGLLPTEQSMVLSLYYFEGYCWEDVCEKVAHTTKTVRKLKDKGIDALVEMYRFADGVS